MNRRELPIGTTIVFYFLGGRGGVDVHSAADAAGTRSGRARLNARVWWLGKLGRDTATSRLGCLATLNATLGRGSARDGLEM